MVPAGQISQAPAEALLWVPLTQGEQLVDAKLLQVPAGQSSQWTASVVNLPGSHWTHSLAPVGLMNPL